MGLALFGRPRVQGVLSLLYLGALDTIFRLVVSRLYLLYLLLAAFAQFSFQHLLILQAGGAKRRALIPKESVPVAHLCETCRWQAPAQFGTGLLKRKRSRCTSPAP